MKKIVLAPVKNEGWILRDFLANLGWADLVILADQHSTDDTARIAADFPNVRIIANDNEGHSNRVRWQLLDEARASFPDEKRLVFCLDADEMIGTQAVAETVRIAEKEDGRAIGFAYPWIQLFGSKDSYRTDGVWKDNIRAIAFTDSSAFSTPFEYPREVVINDHTDRIPRSPSAVSDEPVLLEQPVLHLHFLAKKRSAIKQAWYMCQEIIKSGRDPRHINFQYAPSIALEKAKTSPVPREWLEGIDFPKADISASDDPIRLAEIMQMFDEHGIERFEPLDIWSIADLRDEFASRTGRNPRPVRYPKIGIWLYARIPTALRAAAKKAIKAFLR